MARDLALPQVAPLRLVNLTALTTLGSAMVGRGGELTPGEVATRLDVAHSTVLRWEATGDLIPCRRLPSGHRRYDPADVVALEKVLAIADADAREAALAALRQRNRAPRG